MGCIWAGRWKQYFQLKKQIHEWHKQGMCREHIENKLRRELEGVQLKVVNG
tara:strand:+ start:5915 stop:6067 length:153 start_codon:yes stop_codon:yes gene_type:complete